MRSGLLQEMSTYSKTGGQMPWERETSRTVENTPVRANLNQDELVALADEVAKRIRFNNA
jgi:hypothetical protein